MKSFFNILILVCGLVACQNNPSTDSQTQTNTVEISPITAAVADTKTASSAEDATSVTYLETSVGAIPVYKSYDDLAYLFEQEDDMTYVINFWATWCKPCVEELPYFEQMQEKYKDENVQVILISLDFKRQLEKKLKPFLEKRKLQSEVVVLADSKYNNWIDNVDEIWDGAIPVTLIYNTNKREFANYQFANYDELEAVLKRVKG